MDSIVNHHRDTDTGKPPQVPHCRIRRLLIPPSHTPGSAEPARKSIPAARDRLQSVWLVGLVGLLLGASVSLVTFEVVGMSGPPRWFLASFAVSAAFALLVWRLRASTAPAAAIGGVISLSALLRRHSGVPWLQTALPELIALFVITFAASRFHRRRTHAFSDPRELRHGRTAAQIVANLGFAGLCLASPQSPVFLAGLAALAEATADTVASELGQAFAGPTLLLTTWRRVPPGTDGGISLIGTALGLAAAALIAALAVLLGVADLTAGILLFLAAAAGLFFDSLLGATIERRGWIGNDLVNFASTVLAGILFLQAFRFLEPPLPYW